MRSSLLLLFVLVGCASTNQHAINYRKNIDVSQIPEVEVLGSGIDPQIYSSQNFQRDYSVLMSKGYILLGYSNFQGQLDKRYNVLQVGRDVGASVIITSNNFLGRDTTTVPLLLPTSSTTYSSGNFSGNGNTSYYGNYGQSYGTSRSTYNGSYTGSQTTQSSQWVPITTTKNIYKQRTAFFVKTNQKFKFGAYYRDLTPEERKTEKNNTGVVLTTVIEGTPAFKANLIAGDVIISVNGNKVTNYSHMSNIVNRNGKLDNVIFMRNGKNTSVLFNKEKQHARTISSEGN